jgi:hypothetical protein
LTRHLSESLKDAVVFNMALYDILVTVVAVHWDMERLEDYENPLAQGVQAEACR